MELQQPDFLQTRVSYHEHAIDDTSSYEQNIAPHPNVALLGYRDISEYNNENEYHASTVHSETLADVITRFNTNTICWSDEYRRRILLQITHGLHHMHKHGIAHGNLVKENILFPHSSTDHHLCGNIVITDCIPRTGYLPSSTHNDIRDLTDIFEYVMKSGTTEFLCKDHIIVKRLLQKMRTQQLNTEHILADPFFWSDDKKINFMLRSYDILESFKRLEDLNTKRLSDWAHILDLTGFELDCCNDNAENNQSEASQSAVTERARKKFKNKHTLISELLRFFRNTKTHFHSLPVPVRMCFEMNETEKYWSFFSRRFPDFFYHVYDIMKKDGWIEEKGVREIYVEEICENKLLQDPQSHVSDRIKIDELCMPDENSALYINANNARIG